MPSEHLFHDVGGVNLSASEFTDDFHPIKLIYSDVNDHLSASVLCFTFVNKMSRNFTTDIRSSLFCGINTTSWTFISEIINLNMQFIIPFCLLCVVVLQQIVDVTSTQRNSTDMLKRLPVPRRLRAPLLGRSVSSIENASQLLTSTAENDLISLNKRRFSITLFGRHRWMGPKRKGPLLG